MPDKAVAQFKMSWDAMHSGLEKSHKLALLQNGAQLQPFSATARQSQLIETREFELKCIANWLGIPVHKVGHDGRTSYNSLEMENQAFLDDAIDPWLVKIEQEFYEKLLTEEQKESEEYTIEFMRAALVRADIQARYHAYQIAIQYGIMNRNEVRGKENLNPVEGGDEFVLPQNIFGKPEEDEPTPAETPQEEEKPEATEGKSLRQAVAQQILLKSVLTRMATRIGFQARKAAKSPKKFGDWLDTFEAEHRSVVHESVREVVATLPFEDVVERTNTIVTDLFSELKAHLNTEYSTKPESQFAGAVDKRMAFYETQWPQVTVDSQWTTVARSS